ncbi:MAG: TlpA family protein disulfide reductase [Alphaproteobacteria bacterium]
MDRLKLFGLMLAGTVGGFAIVLAMATLLKSGDPARHLATGEMAGFQFQTNPIPVNTSGFVDETGTDLTLADFEGRTILVNLWATWCAPCVEELPTLDALQDSLGSERFEVVTISIDRGGPDKPKAFFDRLGLSSLTLYRDPSTKIGVGLEATGLPTTVLIDERGREVGRYMGPADWNAPEARALIKSFIPAQDSESSADDGAAGD